MKEISGEQGGGVSSSPCTLCKILRRRCSSDCIFAPYFPAADPRKFASVHEVFGASNVCRLLQELPEQQRGDAVTSLVYEANCRIHIRASHICIDVGDSGGGGVSSSPCAACKILRRRCSSDCILAPYFPAADPLKFASVHKVFGASNVCRLLRELPEQQRGDAVSTMVYEANARIRDHTLNICMDFGDYGPTDRQIVYQQWKDYMASKKSSANKNWVLSEPTLVVVGQAAGAALSRSIADFNGAIWPKVFMDTAVLVGFACTIAGIGMRRVKPELSDLMGKVGAMVTALAVLLSLGTAIPLALALPAGIIAFLIVAYSVGKS